MAALHARGSCAIGERVAAGEHHRQPVHRLAHAAATTASSFRTFAARRSSPATRRCASIRADPFRLRHRRRVTQSARRRRRDRRRRGDRRRGVRARARRDGLRVHDARRALRRAPARRRVGMGHLVVMDDSPGAARAHDVLSLRALARARARACRPRVEYDACGTLWVAEDERELDAVRREAARCTPRQAIAARGPRRARSGEARAGSARRTCRWRCSCRATAWSIRRAPRCGCWSRRARAAPSCASDVAVERDRRPRRALRRRGDSAPTSS